MKLLKEIGEIVMVEAVLDKFDPEDTSLPIRILIGGYSTGLLKEEAIRYGIISDTVTAKCPSCKGVGESGNECSVCKGSGTLEVELA